ncbi:MAG: hypothetical protein LW630_03075 [Saprospiraceae bacterium]|jgi:uncharacterized protein (TIGR00661 family)|nr:hypothetical protein [Saprospiraceae bacterium]
MKILYSVQATGNGHISRAHQLYPYLTQFGNVDILLSGSNASLQMDIPVKFRSKGLSLFYATCGGLDYTKTALAFNPMRIRKEAKGLPVEKYDLVINDFDHITARACAMKKVPSVQFGHQASFLSESTPRPDKKSMLGEYILKNYAPATRYVGLHFSNYDAFIFPPIIKQAFIDAAPADHGHITVYLPAYNKECVEDIMKFINPTPVHWFLHGVQKPFVQGNIHYFPIQQDYFNQSLIYCHGIVTGGGFETPAEALYLGKKVLTIPIDGQYEQQCNAAALKQLGVLSLKELSLETKSIFCDWVWRQKSNVQMKANNIQETLQYVFA